MAGDQGDESKESLYECAVRADAGSTRWIELSSVWKDLGLGRCRISASFFTDERCYLVLSLDEALAERRHGLSRDRLEVFRRVLLDGGQKMVALDIGVTQSTINLRAKRCLEYMGLSCAPSRVPPLLVMAAHAQENPGAAMQARSAEVVWEGRPHRVVSVVRPDTALAGRLSEAEYRVACLFVEGKSYVEIARHRETSVRTVANQLSATFQRLGISGRSALLHRLSVLQVASNEQARRDPGSHECA